jgi:CheY-like chemotaxis protein
MVRSVKSFGVPSIDIHTALRGDLAVKIIEDDLKKMNYKMTSFCLILMDCNMAVMNGYTAT